MSAAGPFWAQSRSAVASASLREAQYTMPEVRVDHLEGVITTHLVRMATAAR